MTWRSRDWCCSLFRSAYERRYERGQFVFVSPPLPRVCPRYSFWLATRSVLREDLDRLPEGTIAPPDVGVYLSCHQAIKFCPWCGHRLSRFYGRRAEQLVDPVICGEFKVPGYDVVSQM